MDTTNKKSTLGTLMPPFLRYLKASSKVLPGSLGPLNRFSPLWIEFGLPTVKALAAYFKILEQGLEGKNKIVVHPFNFPPEILHAMDVTPVFIEILSTLSSFAPATFFPDKNEKYLDYGYEGGLPGSLCSGQLSGAGAMLYGDFPKPDAILNGAPGFCDVNSKIMEYTARTLEVPLFHVDMSPYKDERGFQYYRKSFRHVISQLEDFTGNRLDLDRLRETVKNTNRMIELGNDIFDLQSVKPSPVSNYFNLINMTLRFCMGGRPEAIPVFEAVLNGAKRKMKQGKGALREEKVRCLWLYTGVYFDLSFFLHWTNQIGMSVTMDILSYFPIEPIDTTSMDTMIDGLAREALKFPMIKQMHAPADVPGSWIEDMVFLAKKYKVDCCIFFANPACKRANGAFRLLSDRIKKDAGVPVLKLEADAWDRRITPIESVKEKIQKFLETIV
jgi:benzoyl-CoA reductase subunit B